jgi:hypothetical protein
MAARFRRGPFSAAAQDVLVVSVKNGANLEIL